MNENEILGFDPQSLFNKPEEGAKQANPQASMIYKTRPAESVSEDHVYRATLKLVYNPFDFKHSILEQQSYAMEDANGWFTVISSLTNNDTTCPVFSAWKKCRYAKEEALNTLAKPISEGGMFDKRFARYVTVQIIKDKNQPNLEGKYMFWKLPKAVYDIVNAKMNPSKDSGKSAIPVMDFLFGRAIDIEVTPGPGNPGDERYSRETKYMAELSEDVVTVVNPDGSPILTDEQQAVLDKYVRAMKEVWKNKDAEERNALLAKINADENTIALRTIYAKVLEVIKEQCPNITEELGYSEWSDNMKARVQNWIDIVLAGGNPKTTVTSNTTVSAPEAPAQTAPAEAAPMPAGDDDLPF